SSTGALEALEAAGNVPPAELARHALAAGFPEEAFRHSIAAGDAARGLFAPRDAAVHYELARRLFGNQVMPAPELERLHARLRRTHEFSGAYLPGSLRVASTRSR
ncbi:MAG: hypothetical protein ACRDTR_22595, partial [Rubrobacter sp.]